MELRVRVVHLSEAKDPNELHKRGPAAFRSAFQAAMDVAEPLALPSPTKAPLPEIVVTERRLRDISADAWGATQSANDPPTLFQRGRLLVDIVPDDDGLPILRTLSPPAFKGFLDRIADFLEESGEGGSTPARPPSDVVADMMSAKSLLLPILLGITQVPIFTPDGTLVMTPGYQPHTRMFLAPPKGLVLPPVPPNPSREDIERAKALLLDELLADFPFASDADRSHAVAIAILPLVRNLVEGPTPLHLIESPTPGTGKGLLTDVLAIPVLGAGPPVMTEAASEEEWRKRITAKLLQGPQFVLIDNVRHGLDSSSLSAALTAPQWEDRVLGYSRIAHIPVRCVWIATANNPSLSLEVARRTIPIRLDAGIERPWQRGGFKHANLRRWAREHRADLLWATLTLCQTWVAAGMPRADGQLGSYESWDEVIGGILDVADIPGFLGNLGRVYESSDRESTDWAEFCEVWWVEFRGQLVRSEQLFGLAARRKLLLEVWTDRTEQGARTSFGKRLAKMRDRVVGNFRILEVSQDAHDKVKRYRLEQGSGPGADKPAGVAGVAGVSDRPTEDSPLSEMQFVAADAPLRPSHAGESSPEGPENPRNPRTQDGEGQGDTPPRKRLTL